MSPDRAARTAKSITPLSSSRENADEKLRETGKFPKPVSLRVGTRILRARAREMCNDAPHFKKFLKMCRTNVIGPHGLRLQCRAYNTDGKTLNVDLNKRVEAAFWDWGHAETCTLSGKMNWKACQRLFITQLARDGEVLVQKIEADNGWGFSLKFWNVDYLDETYNAILPNGNRIIMSVEIDGNDRPVAYWLTTPFAEIIMFPETRDRFRTRVAASEMIHAFLVEEDESQVRGLTLFVAGLLQGKSLYSYVQGVVTQARITAMSLGFIEEDADLAGENQYTGGEDPNGNERNPEVAFYPGGFTRLLPGQKLNQFDPKQPTQNHAEFKKTMESDCAVAFGVHYFSLSGDMEAVNYSSARVGLGEERDMWKELQDFVAEKFCREVYHEWAKAAMFTGKLQVKAREFDQIQNPNFQGRGWAYLDPMKEVNASVLAMGNNLATLTGELAKQGIDIDDHFETIKAERELAAKYGIDLVYVTKVTATETADPSAGEGDSTGKDGEKPPAKREMTNGHGLQHIDEEIA
jgi:lambda family phage portal protein